MEKFILDLIKDNNRVIIPNFGAFIISKEDGINVLFNNFLSFNDGLLINYIAEQKNIDTVLATEEVFAFVDKIKEQLEVTGEYSIKGLGEFKKDTTGILRFTKASNFTDIYEGSAIIEEKSDSLELSEEPTPTESNLVSDELLDIDNSEEIEETEITESTIDTIPNEPILTIDSEEDTDNTKEEEVKNRTANQEETIRKTENTYASQMAATKMDAKESEVKKTAVSNQKTAYRTTKPIKKENKSKNSIIILIVLLIIIAGITSYILLIHNPAKKEATKKAQEIKIEQQKPIVTDTLPKVEEEKPAIEEPIEPEKTINTVSNKICIIVGGFKEEQNAINMVEKLKNKGYENAQIIPGKGTLFLVSIDSDESYQKMEQRQQEILNNEKMDSWLYKVK